LKNDETIYKAALNKAESYKILKYFSQELRNDKNVIYEAMKENNDYIEYASN